MPCIWAKGLTPFPYKRKGIFLHICATDCANILDNLEFPCNIKTMSETIKNNSVDFNPEVLPEEFVKLYGGAKEDVQVYAGPARINIIGEHIDYNGGKVFPTAIDKYMYVAIRKRED